MTSLVFTSLFCGTAVAKEADMPIHMMFSQNVDMVNSSEISVVESDEVQAEDNFQNDIVENIGSYEETFLTNDEGITYTIIYDEKVPDLQETFENASDPKHVHKYVNVTIKEHKKNTDGSCITMDYSQ